MGIRTVAVFSEADRDALHVELADVAYPIGPAPARDSYLRIDRIVEAALRSGAEAIHPGYGFLSENADFAEASAAAGLVFVGPPPSAIRAMGSKAAAKALMERAGVPLVPGYHGENQDPALLETGGRTHRLSGAHQSQCRRWRQRHAGGRPAVRLPRRPCGRSGRGSSLVRRRSDAHRALPDAAAAHRGAGLCRSLRQRGPPLFERDCSIQRRHQKVVEEAPAPGMTAERRDAMGRARLRCRSRGLLRRGRYRRVHRRRR